MTDKEKLFKLKELADAMYNSAQYLTTDASRLHKAMDEYHQFIIHEYRKEEPVSEDLEDAAYNFVMDNFGNPKEPLYKFDQRCFKAGAKWREIHLSKDFAWKVYNFIGSYKSGKFGEHLTLQQAIDKYFKDYE